MYQGMIILPTSSFVMKRNKHKVTNYLCYLQQKTYNAVISFDNSVSLITKKDNTGRCSINWYWRY